MDAQKHGMKRKVSVRIVEHQQLAAIILLFCQQHRKREKEANNPSKRIRSK
jgi:hypothetical protein